MALNAQDSVLQAHVDVDPASVFLYKALKKAGGL
jgi:hypothetical protein